MTDKNWYRNDDLLLAQQEEVNALEESAAIDEGFDAQDAALDWG